MEIVLTTSQNEAFNKIKEFLLNDEPALVINGSAGVGKSTLMKYVANFISESCLDNQSIIAIAPTHKARRVISNMLNEGKIIPITTKTIASLLGKVRELSYIGTKKFSDPSAIKMNLWKYFILDEVSMVMDKDLNVILDYICSSDDKKIIIIGDQCQIPSPAQQLVIINNECVKGDSLAFGIKNIITLKEIVRQNKDSVIIQIATYIRDNILIDTPIINILKICNIDSVNILLENCKLYENVTKDIINNMSTRIIAYTNENVRNHNLEVRKKFGYINPYMINEVLVGYNNVGYPNPIIENGSDYKIVKISKTITKKIGKYLSLAGYFIDLQNMDNSKEISNNLFFITINNLNNNLFMNDLITLAEKVNNKKSTLTDFKAYHSLKNKAIFIDDVFKYLNIIYTELDFKKNHPMLFTKVTDTINTKKQIILKNDFITSFTSLYPDLIEDRLNDPKEISENEVYADQFKVIEKDIYYGYSITSHKSQGSTYDSVYVDDIDFNKIQNRFNFKFMCTENRIKEKNQLKYVAYTRASKKLTIVI